VRLAQQRLCTACLPDLRVHLARRPRATSGRCSPATTSWATPSTALPFRRPTDSPGYDAQGTIPRTERRSSSPRCATATSRSTRWRSTARAWGASPASQAMTAALLLPRRPPIAPARLAPRQGEPRSL